MPCFCLAVVKSPKRWWRRAPKSRESLRRCTGKWGSLQGSRWDGQKGLKAGFAKFTITRKEIRLPTVWPYVVFPGMALLPSPKSCSGRSGWVPLWVSCSVGSHNPDQAQQVTWTSRKYVGCYLMADWVCYHVPLELLSVLASVHQMWPVSSRLFHTEGWRWHAHLSLAPLLPKVNLVISGSRACIFINMAIYVILRS